MARLSLALLGLLSLSSAAPAPEVEVADIEQRDVTGCTKFTIPQVFEDFFVSSASAIAGGILANAGETQTKNGTFGLSAIYCPPTTVRGNLDLARDCLRGDVELMHAPRKSPVVRTRSSIYSTPSPCEKSIGSGETTLPVPSVGTSTHGRRSRAPRVCHTSHGVLQCMFN